MQSQVNDWDWRHWSGLATVAGVLLISCYEQFWSPKVVLVHDMIIIRDFCFSYSGIMFGHILRGQNGEIQTKSQLAIPADSGQPKS